MHVNNREQGLDQPHAAYKLQLVHRKIPPELHILWHGSSCTQAPATQQCIVKSYLNERYPECESLVRSTEHHRDAISLRELLVGGCSTQKTKEGGLPRLRKYTSSLSKAGAFNGELCGSLTKEQFHRSEIDERPHLT